MPIKRRTLLSGLAAGAAATTLGCDRSPDMATEALRQHGARNAKRLSPQQHLNIILLCIDDLRDWVGYMDSHPGVHTPNIDRLRARSLSFDHAYCSVPVCLASRGSTLWGISPQSAGLYTDSDLKPYRALFEDPNLQPLPWWFSQAGYETISTGKVFHWGMGTKRYWDVFKPYPSIPVTYGDHGTFFDFGLLPEGEQHADQVAADFAVQQINQARKHSWFMAIGLFQPHVPWRLPKWAFDLHPLDDVVLPVVRDDDLEDIPPAGVKLAQFPSLEAEGKTVTGHDLVVGSGLWRNHVQAYLAACSHTDAMVGQILDALDNSPHAQHTAVVLWSDHGYHLGEKLHWRKMALWEQATRVPLLLDVPGRVEANSSFDSPVSLLDLAPTLTDIAGIPTPSQFQGQSLLGITREQARARPAHMVWGEAESLRVDNWRWTRYADGGEELYNLAEDPREHNNLLGRTGRHQGGIEALLERS